MELLQTYLSRAAKDGASDLFFVPGAPVSYKLEGLLVPMDAQRLTTMHSEQLITEIYTLAERDLGVFQASGDDDFSFAIPGLARFRVNAYRQRGSWAVHSGADYEFSNAKQWNGANCRYCGVRKIHHIGLLNRSY